MSIAKQAARGVAWNMLFGVSSRMVQLFGMLIITRFIAPDQYAAVITASIAVLTAGVFTSFAFGQHMIAKKSEPKIAFQALVVHTGIGIVAMVVLYSIRWPLGSWMNEPQMGDYLLGYAVANVLDRARYIPERLLMRGLKFRQIASINATGEILFTALSLSLAHYWGGHAIEFAAVCRSFVQFILYFRTAPREEWLAVTRLKYHDVKDLFVYGLPIMIAGVSDRAATRWDNIIMSKLFTDNVMGLYGLAYSLAEMPVINIAEQIGEVLMPSFALMEPAQRQRAVVRSASLLQVIVAPLGVGLGAVSATVVPALFNTKWAGMAPMLTILSIMTVFRPMTWAATAYLQAVMQTRLFMYSSFFRAVVVLSGVYIGGSFGQPEYACWGGVVGYALHSIVTIVVAGRICKFSSASYLIGVARPLLPCIPMFFGVIGLQEVLHGHMPLVVSLVIQVIAGMAIYAVAALVLVRSASKDIIRLGKEAIGRRGRKRMPTVPPGPQETIAQTPSDVEI
ncbi:MAG: oligosaccharide flippase family protein [Kofleriaceae bacterium]